MQKLRPAIDTEMSVLCHFSAVWNDQQTTAVKHAAHTHVVDIASQFWRSGAAWWQLFGHMNYGGLWKIATNHQRWTNAMNRPSCHPPEERLFSASTDSLRKRILLRLEHKSI